MNTHKTEASLVAVVTGVVAAFALLLAAPAGAQVAVNGSVASGDGSFAGNHSTTSGQAVAVNGSVASGCSFAANGSTASGGVCPAPAAKAPKPHVHKVQKPHAHKVHKHVHAAKVTVAEAKAAPVTRVQSLAFTGPRVAPLVATATALLAVGAALMALTSPRRRVLPTSS